MQTDPTKGPGAKKRLPMKEAFTHAWNRRGGERPKAPREKRAQLRGTICPICEAVELVTLGHRRPPIHEIFKVQWVSIG